MSDRRDLQSIPGEMREMIYGMVFIDSLDQAATLDILLLRVPGSTALRCTSKFISAETARCYHKAAVIYDKKRLAIASKTAKQYEHMHQNHGYTIAWTLIWKRVDIREVARGLATTEMRSCLHACKKTGCYMCNDPVHRNCFNCGRNLLVPLYSKLHNDQDVWSILSSDEPQVNVPPPTMVIPETNATVITPMARLVTRLRQRYFQESVMRTIKRSQLWAYLWWHCVLQDQRAFEIRLSVRKRAVQRHWEIPTHLRPPFTEPNIKFLEKLDRRYMTGAVAKQKSDDNRPMVWRDEYVRRAKAQAAREGVDVRKLIPKGH